MFSWSFISRNFSVFLGTAPLPALLYQLRLFRRRLSLTPLVHLPFRCFSPSIDLPTNHFVLFSDSVGIGCLVFGSNGKQAKGNHLYSRPRSNKRLFIYYHEYPRKIKRGQPFVVGFRLSNELNLARLKLS